MSVEPAVDGEVQHVRTVAGGLQGYKQPGPGSLLPHADLGSLEQFGDGSTPAEAPPFRMRKRAGASWSKPDYCPVFEFGVRAPADIA